MPCFVAVSVIKNTLDSSVEEVCAYLVARGMGLGAAAAAAVWVWRANTRAASAALLDQVFMTVQISAVLDRSALGQAGCISLPVVLKY